MESFFVFFLLLENVERVWVLLLLFMRWRDGLDVIIYVYDYEVILSMLY